MSGLALYIRGMDKAENTVLPLRGTDHTENTSHVIAIQQFIGADCCLATSYNIRPHLPLLRVFTEPLPGNALIKSFTILIMCEKIM
jgi:hypothetical protein